MSVSGVIAVQQCSRLKGMLRALCETLIIKRAIIFYSFAIQFLVINAIHILLNNLRCFIQRLPGPYVLSGLSGGPLIFTFSFFS